MKLHLGHLLGLSAISLASCAAFFSVFGLSQLFAGASIAVIIMASTLELSKLVIASYLHAYWNTISKVMKIYFTIGVIILVLITSAGIYGFLSNAFQKTANNLELFDGETLKIQSKLDQYSLKLTNNEKAVDLKYKRINQLTDLRTSQEARLSQQNSRNNRLEITNSNKEIEKLNSEIDKINAENSIIGDSISKFKADIIEVKGENITAGEVGPLKYMSELSGKPMNVIVNYFILLLVFVFDPLAVCLVIATISVFNIKKNNITKDPSLNETYNEDVTEEVNSINEGVNDAVNESPNDAVNESPNEVIKEQLKSPRQPIKIENIKEIKDLRNRGFSMNVPKNNVIFNRNGRIK